MIDSFISSALSKATGIYHCMNSEREMELDRVTCETWLEEMPNCIFAFALICGKTYYRPGYFDMSLDKWVIPND